MNTEIKLSRDTVTVYLTGEIDHHNSASIREKIDECLISANPKRLILDFDKVSFMDSSGIGLIMGRYRLIEQSGCKMAVINLSSHAYRVMQLAGMEKLATLKKKSKEEKTNESN